MTLDITVRGSSEGTYPAERGTLSLAVVLEGPDRDDVLRTATDLHQQVTAQLDVLTENGAVSTWSSDQVRVMSHRPYDHEGKQQAPVHAARVGVDAEFVDFEKLAGFLDFWAAREGVEVGGVVWDVSARNRRTYEAEIRKAAVDDALHKAQAYADAVRRGKVVPYQIADPGMLGGSQGGEPPTPMFARAAFDASGGGPSLVLTPSPIVIHVDVDARFTAG